jgi:hypothetical protein
MALEAGANEDQAIAALLHDAVEDHGGAERLADIAARFGPRVARIVADCSDTVEGPRVAWRERKQRYLASLASKSRESLLVSACDKIYNAEAIVSDLRIHGEALWDRFSGSAEDILWYYRSLAEAFQRYLPGPSADRLARLTKEMRNLAERNRKAMNRTRPSKYDPLRDFLRTKSRGEFTLSFAEIERILGGSLPKSAATPQWWSNVLGSDHPQKRAWQSAGFDAFLVAGSRKVRFRSH